MLSYFNTPITPMNFNNEHNTKSTMLSDIATVNDTCNTHTANFTNYSDYNICDHELDLDPDNNFFAQQAGNCKYYTDEVFSEEINFTDGISIIHFNCRSIESNFDSINQYLHKIKSNFGVIALSETWLPIYNDLNHFKISNYIMYNTFRSDRCGGGVALYIKQSLQCSLIKQFSTSIPMLLERLAVEITIQGNKNIVIGCMYRSPNGDFNKFNEYVDMFLNYNKNKTIFVCGDFNVNLLNHGQHQLTDNFLDILHGYGLYTLITQPTRITIHSATLLDNIFTNVPFNNSKSGVIINDISDHLPIFAFINYRGWISNENLKKYKTIRQFTDENMQVFNNYLIRFDWTTITSSTDVDECYSLFINETIDAINFHCPLKKVHFRTSHNPWMTKGLINACNKKNNLYKKFIKTEMRLMNKDIKSTKIN